MTSRTDTETPEPSAFQTVGQSGHTKTTNGKELSLQKSQGPSGKGDKMMMTKHEVSTKDIQELLTKSRTK